jgi:molybdopterin molybdotransferase
MSNPSPTPFFDVRTRGFSTRTDVDDAVALICARVSELGFEPVELEAAAVRVLAGAVVATVPVPHFDGAAFDGYAVRAEESFGAGPDNPLTLRVVGEAFPPRPFGRVAGSGEAVRIMTGSPMPAGANADLPAESAEEADRLLKIVEPIVQGKNVGRTMSDCGSRPPASNRSQSAGH